MTARGLRITRLGQEIRTAVAERVAGPSLLHLRDCTATFRCGRRTRGSFILGTC